MPDIAPPLVVIDGRDVMAFERLSDLQPQIEAYDVDNYEFYDSQGKRLIATVDGYRVALQAGTDSTADPGRLESALKEYFAGLGERDQRFVRYVTAAAQATSLRQLLELRLQLSAEAAHRGLFSRLRRRKRGF